MEDKEQWSKITNNLYYFYRVFVGSKFKENLPAPHIKSLSRELMKMARGDYKRLCVAIGPRHSKSSMVTLAMPMWRVFKDPNLNILIINNSSSLSEKFGIQLREYIREYGELFNVYLSNVKQSQSYLMFEDKDGKLYNGSIRLVGKGGAITGMDVDLCIVDDLYKGLEEEFTQTALQKTVDWFNTVVEQRIEPHTELVILHTRWHSDDLQGWIKKNDANSYHFLEYPAIKDDGTPLWPERYTIEDLEDKKKKVGERMFSSLYQQKPLDETGDFFDLTNLKKGTPDGDIIYSVRAWDIASADEKLDNGGDYSVGAKMDLYPDGNVCINSIKRGQYGNKLKDVLLETAQLDGMDYHVLIETGVAGAGKLLYSEYEEALKPYIVERAMPVKSKEDRATPLRNAILDGHIYLDLTDSELVECEAEFKSFPHGKNDDIIDSLSHGYNFLCRQERGNKPDLTFINL